MPTPSLKLWLVIVIILSLSPVLDLIAQSNNNNNNNQLEEILQSNQPSEVIKGLNNHFWRLDEPTRLYYYALSFDKANQPLKAIVYAKKYLYKFGDIFLVKGLAILEVALRNHYQELTTIDFSYKVSTDDIMELRKEDPAKARSLLHYIFLNKLRSNQENEAFALYLSNTDSVSDFSYRLSEKLYNIKETDSFYKVIFLLQNPDDKLLAKSFRIERLIENNFFSQASQAISEIETISPKSYYYVQRLTNHLDRAIYQKPFKVGMIVPLENSRFKYITDQLRAGFYYGLDNFILPKNNIELVLADSGQSKQDITEAYRKLVQEDEVSIILGPITRLATEILNEEVYNYGVPYISYSLSVKPDKINPYSFRFQRNTIAEASDIAEFSRNFLCHQRAAVFYDKKTISQKSAFENKFRALGGEIYGSYLIADFKREFIPIFADISGIELYKKGESLREIPTEDDMLDGTNDVTNDASGDIIVEDKAIDVIFSPIDADKFRLILDYANVYDLGEVDFLGISNLNSKVSLSWSDVSSQVWFANSIVRTPLNERLFVDIWRANAVENNFNERSSYVFYAYLSAQMLSAALQENPLIGSSLLSSWFATLSDFETEFGKVHYNHNHELVLDPQIVKLASQKFKKMASYDKNVPSNCVAP